MPREEDIISLCIYEDRLMALSSSPILSSLQLGTKKFHLYEGILSNIADIFNRHEVQMNEKFNFKKQKQQMLKYKTLYAL